MAKRASIYNYLGRHASTIVQKWDNVGLLGNMEGNDRINLASYLEEGYQYILQKGWDDGDFITSALPVIYRCYDHYKMNLNIPDLLTKLHIFLEPEQLKLHLSLMEGYIGCKDPEAEALCFFINHYTGNLFKFQRLKKIEL